MPPVWLGLVLLLTTAIPASAAGRIEGRLTRPDGSPFSGVTIRISETQRTTISSETGAWSLDEVADGAYTLVFSLDRFTESADVVVAGQDVRVDRVLNWDLRFEETVVVYGATRQRERLVETPVAASIIPSTSIVRDGGHGLLPKVLQAVPAVEVVQSGLFDFNINMRGFNRALNRRVLVLIDGRDPSGVLLGAQEWVASGIDPQQIAQVEVIRGPGSALYGANAFNGIVSFLSTEPRDAPGGYAQVTVGERSTFGASAATSGRAGTLWSYRAFGSATRSDDFYRDRTTSVEYEGLQPELVSPLDRTYGISGSLRFDRALAPGLWTIEGGSTRSSGQIFLTGVGRSQTVLVNRPWLRSAIQQGWWQVSGYADGRRGESLSLGTGGSQFDDSLKGKAEFLARFNLTDARTRLMAGASVYGDRIDTADDSGRQTLLNDKQSGHATAVFGQADWTPADHVTLVAAIRVDENSWFPVQASPKIGGAVTVSPGHTLRASYGRAFQAPAYGELAPRVDVAPPLDLSPLEAALSPVTGGVPLGFSSVPVLALGNDALDVERVDGVDAGYSGVLGSRMLISAEYYRTRMRDFISGLLPNVGTSLGRVNPAYQAYAPPAALTPTAQAIVLGTLQAVLPPTLFPLMSNDADGAPIFAALSFTNYGEVVAQGVDIDAQVFPADKWSMGLGYSFFHFDVREDLPDDPISANTTPHRVNAWASYTSSRWAGSARFRWSDAFDWANGLQRGPVPAYGIVDMAGTVALTDRVQLRLNVANLFDNEHYEIFGGDLIGRRAVVDVQFRW